MIHTTLCLIGFIVTMKMLPKIPENMLKWISVGCGIFLPVYGCFYNFDDTIMPFLKSVTMIIGVAGIIYFTLFNAGRVLGFLKNINKGIVSVSKKPKTKKPATQRPGILSQPKQLYHGTKKLHAYEIYNTGLWLIGNSAPAAVWMTDRIEIAREYAGKKGCIVVVDIDPKVNLTNHKRNVFIYKIPDARPNDEYLYIAGITPVGILDYHGNKLT